MIDITTWYPSTSRLIPLFHLVKLSTVGRARCAWKLREKIRNTDDVIDPTDFNATRAGHNIISDEDLHDLVQALYQHSPA